MEIGKITFDSQKRDGGPNEATMRIDGIKAWASIVATVVLPLFLLLNVTLPKSKSDIRLEEQRHKFELLQFALSNEDDSIRCQSINLLLVTGLLEDESNELKKLMDRNELPDWSKLKAP